MRTIAIMNQKGGVGKTTTAVNVSAALADAGAKVCLFDLDPQAHTTLHLGADAESDGVKSLHDVFMGEKRIADVRVPINSNLALVPAHLDMVGDEIMLASAVGREQILQSELAADDTPYDYIIIDCPPTLGVFTLNALTAVNEVFVPIQPHFLPLRGFMQLVSTLELVSRRLNKNLKLTRILFTLHNGTTLAAEVEQEIVSFFANSEKLPPICKDAAIFETKIRNNIRLAEAPSYGKSIFDYDNKSNGAEDYRNLAKEMMRCSAEPTM